jgi:hypothetical protein
MKARVLKPVDSSTAVSAGSRADNFHKSRGIVDLLDIIRPNLKFKDMHNDNSERVMKTFKIDGLGFGNWVTIEDRINYINAIFLGLYDLNKILKFGGNMGFNNLKISIGARGKGRALAHYEPLSKHINITRYKRCLEQDKYLFFITSGGIHSFAHEYGHYLDYYVSLDKMKSNIALSGGQNDTRTKIGFKDKIGIRFDNLMYAIQNDSKGNPSIYMKRLEKVAKLKPYWFRRNEIFARAFEVYVTFKLAKNGIENLFLSKPKYNKNFYLTESEMIKIEPLFDDLINEMRKVLMK